MQERPNYLKLAWSDVRSSQGWLAKCLILGLVGLIPVFGPIVLYGYAFGWARDVAWGVREPLPRRVFGNEDGHLYSRGFFAFVLFFVCGIIPLVASSVLSAITGMHGSLFANFWYGHGMVPLVWLSSGFGLVTLALTVAVGVMAFLFAEVGSLRIAIYDRMSAGFQFGKVWAMIRRDARGIWGVFWRMLATLLLVGVAVAAIVGLVTALVVFFGMLLFGGIAGAGHGSAAGAGLAVLSLVYVGVAILLYAAVGVLSSVASAAVSLAVARATGLWCYQFDVASWRGQDDPLPFESRVG